MVGVMLVGIAVVAMVIFVIFAYRKPGPEQEKPGDRTGETW